MSDNLAGLSILGCRFFSFSTLNISCHSFWIAKCRLKQLAHNIMGYEVSSYVTSCFSLVAVKILCLSLSFDILIIMYLCLDSFGLSCLGLFLLPVLGCLFPFPE